MSATRFSATILRLLALACAVMLLGFGHVWAYGTALLVLPLGLFGLYLVRLAGRLGDGPPPPGSLLRACDRGLQGLLVLGFVVSLAALLFVR